MAVSLIYDPAYLKHDTGHHPENAHRLEAILHALESGDLPKRLRAVKPSAAKLEDLTRCHHEDMVEHVRRLCEQGARHIDMDTQISRESYDVALLAAGAAMAAVDCAFAAE